MPNPTIDKFQIGNTTYDFIDSTARNTADAAVPQTRKVNNKALSADVILTSDDIGYDSTETYSSGTIGNELTQLSTAKIQKDTYRVYYGTIETGKWTQTNGNEHSSSYALGIGINVNGGEEYYVSGVSVSTDYPLVVLFGTNHSPIGYLHNEGNYTPFTDLKIVIPDNCEYIWVNSRFQNETCIYSYVYANTDGNDLVANIKSKEPLSVTWKKSTYEFVSDAFINVTGSATTISINSSQVASGYSYAKLTYDKSKRYRFCASSRGTTIPAIVCTDENNVILKKFDVYVDSEITVRLKEYTAIPEETYYIYVNGYLTNQAYIEEATTRDTKSLKSGFVGVFFGDSVTQGMNVMRKKMIPFEDFPSIVGNVLGCTIYNGGLGGSAFYGNRKIDFSSVVNCVINGNFDDIYDGITEYSINSTATLQYDIIKTLNFASVDFICLSYGTNDWNFGYSKENVKNSMISGIEALMTAFPNLTIYVTTPINRFNINNSGQDADTYVNATSNLKLVDICDAIIDGSQSCHVPCKNMFYDCNITAQNKNRYMGDDTHPNANGYKLIGHKIAGFINAN